MEGGLVGNSRGNVNGGGLAGNSRGNVNGGVLSAIVAACRVQAKPAC